MALEKTYLEISVAETERDRNYWAEKPWISEVIKEADILLLPWENFREGHEIVFPSGSSDFFKSFEGQNSIQIAIASDPDTYCELALHSKKWRWPIILVSCLALPTLSNVLSDQINQRMQAAPAEDLVELDVIVERPTGKCIEVKYTGPRDGAVERIMSEAAKCIPELSVPKEK